MADIASDILLVGARPGIQRAYHLSSPRAWSMPQIAEELSRLLGRTVVYEHRTPERQRELLTAAGVPELDVEILLGLDHIFATSVLAETTHTVEQLTGRPPRSVTDWLAEQLQAFSG